MPSSFELDTSSKKLVLFRTLGEANDAVYAANLILCSLLAIILTKIYPFILGGKKNNGLHLMVYMAAVCMFLAVPTHDQFLSFFPEFSLPLVLPIPLQQGVVIQTNRRGQHTVALTAQPIGLDWHQRDSLWEESTLGSYSGGQLPHCPLARLP